MRKRILLWVISLLLVALLAGCTLARPEIADTAGNGQGDMFCGFYLVYDRWENEDGHVLDINSDTEQMLLAYTKKSGMDKDLPAYVTKSGSSIGEVALSVGGKEGEEAAIDIKGTIYLVDDEDQSLQEQGYREIWLQDDVVQAFRDFYVQPPEDMGREDLLPPGETIIVYISREQIDMHGPELEKIAGDAGIHLILKSESPKRLTSIPVYQRADGTLYADENSLRFIMSDNSSHTQTVEHTQTINGKTTKKRVSATISAKMVDALKTVRLVEMNAQNMPLRTTEVTLGDMRSLAAQGKPFRAGKDAAYLIVEETYETKVKDTYVKRTVYSPNRSGDSSWLPHTFHFPLENGLTEAASMNIAF